MVPLSALAHFGPGNTPLAVNHQNLFVASTISFNLAPDVSLSQATTAIEDQMRRLGVPASIHGSFQGTAKVFQQSLANEPYLIAAAVLAVYIVLGVLYESYVHPITILSTLPSAGAGAVLAMIATNTEFSIMALIGATGDRVWRGRRIAPAARHFDRRRADRQPIADPLYDARHLSLPRPLPVVGAAAPVGTSSALARRANPRTRRMTGPDLI
jgi:hypothetical protein